MATGALLVVTTVGSVAAAQQLVRALVEQRLVACGTTIAGTSIYRWRGAVTEESEVVVLLKTRVERWDALQAAIVARHPYEVPELLAFPAERGLDPYLAWLAAE